MRARWPSFNWDALPEGAEIRYRRAVRGKVNRADTDYRWIAASEGLNPRTLGWDRLLSLGIEDEPRHVYGWCVVPGGYLAMHAYPSRARDSAGRWGGIEKQMLFWQPEAEIAPAAAAFFLLEAVASADDTVWWDTWQDPRWSDVDYRLVVPEPACPPIAVDASRLERCIEAGVSELRRRASETELRSVCAQLINGDRPAWLGGIEEPLTPGAVAALLLPWEIEAKVSVAGGIASDRVRVELLGDWSIVALGASPVEAVEAAGEAAERAAMWMGRWSEARVVEVEAADVSAPAQPRLSEAGRALLDFLASEERSFRPPAGLAPMEDAGEIEYLIGAVKEAAAKAPEDDPARGATGNLARRRHLAVKYEEARAWLYAFAAGSRVLEALPPGREDRVPALWFAPLLSVPHQAALNRYSDDELAALIAHSMEEPRQTIEVRTWLEAYRDSCTPPRAERVWDAAAKGRACIADGVFKSE